MAYNVHRHIELWHEPFVRSYVSRVYFNKNIKAIEVLAHGMKFVKKTEQTFLLII